jgi:hypothetical protein
VATCGSGDLPEWRLAGVATWQSGELICGESPVASCRSGEMSVKPRVRVRVMVRVRG